MSDSTGKNPQCCNLRAPATWRAALSLLRTVMEQHLGPDVTRQLFEELTGAPGRPQPEPSRLPIRQAAKAVGKSRLYVRSLIDQGKICNVFRVGGSDKAPRLVVDVAELRRVVDGESLYVPPAVASQTRSQRRRPAVSRVPLHPAVRM